MCFNGWRPKFLEVSKGKVFLLCSALCVVTATIDAFLDNVTTMMLMTPVTMEIAVVLGISPFVLLVPGDPHVELRRYSYPDW